MSRRPQWVPRRADVPGMALATGIGALALALIRVLPQTPFISDILVALIVGATILNTPLRRSIGLALPSAEREPDAYAVGLRFVGKWVLRAAIILLGFKVQTQFFGLEQLTVIGIVGAVSLPSTFFIVHAAAVPLGVRRPMADLVAGGTMICGASAVNAVAPIARAHRSEQGVAIATVFLFSVFALLLFRPIAGLVGLDEAHAGLWSGLAVNDLSSAIAVGKQMGPIGGVMAAAAKSARVLMLAPLLVVLTMLRSEGAPRDVDKSVLDHVPRYLLGYIGLAVVRALGDHFLVGAGAISSWHALGDFDKLLVDLLMATVAAGIGLHLEIGTLLSAGGPSLLLGAAGSGWMASLSLALIVLTSRGRTSAALLVGVLALGASFLVFFIASRGRAQLQLLKQRLASGAPLSLGEATQILDVMETEGQIDEARLRGLLGQVHPSIGELIPVRQSPLPHGEGCRWMTYWEGKSGWALVAVCREPGSATPIHAHPHRLIGKAIEGVLEELRFTELPGHTLELGARQVLGHNDLVETHALDTIHLVRAIGETPSIDLQFRGPEVGRPGKRYRTAGTIDFSSLQVGVRMAIVAEIDDRPGQSGDGAKAGRQAV